MSALLDALDSLISRADGYPGWGRVLFLVTLTLVVASIAVYAVELTRLRRGVHSNAADQTAATDRA